MLRYSSRPGLKVLRALKNIRFEYQSDWLVFEYLPRDQRSYSCHSDKYKPACFRGLVFSMLKQSSRPGLKVLRALKNIRFEYQSEGLVFEYLPKDQRSSPALPASTPTSIIIQHDVY
jgi:hypothetical protein